MKKILPQPQWGLWVTLILRQVLANRFQKDKWNTDPHDHYEVCEKLFFNLMMGFYHKTFVFLTCFIDNILLGQVFLINNNFENVFSMLIIFFRKFWYWKWLLFVKPGNIVTYLWPNKVNFSNKKNVRGFIMSILPIEDLFYRISKWFSIGLTLSPIWWKWYERFLKLNYFWFQSYLNFTTCTQSSHFWYFWWHHLKFHVFSTFESWI